MDDTLVGALGALGSIIFFGSYGTVLCCSGAETVFIRMPTVLAIDIDPIVYQAYKSFACFTTSWLVLFYAPLKFTWWGMVGAGLWVITGVGAITAVRLAGIGPTQSLWSGLSILVSYFWGAYVFKEPIRSQLLAFVALAVMVVGMVGVGWASSGKVSVLDQLQKRWYAAVWLSRAKEAHGISQGERDNDLRNFTREVEENLIPNVKHDVVGAKKYDPEARFFHGVMWAALVGVTNGSFMIPLQYANKDVVGVEYIVSFGIGAITITMLVLAIYSGILVYSGKPCPSFHFSVVAGPALLTGLFWSAGNYCSIYATLYLGMSLGWPLVQCQLVVSAMWAIFYYKEVTSRKAMTVLLGSSLLVVGGAALLSRFGTYK